VSPSCPHNDLPFSSERHGRLRAYHGREEPRAEPAASRHQAPFARIGVAFGCCNGLLCGAPSRRSLNHRAVHGEQREQQRDARESQEQTRWELGLRDGDGIADPERSSSEDHDCKNASTAEVTWSAHEEGGQPESEEEANTRCNVDARRAAAAGEVGGKEPASNARRNDRPGPHVRITILPFSGGRERERSDRRARPLQRRVGRHLLV